MDNFSIIYKEGDKLIKVPRSGQEEVLDINNYNEIGESLDMKVTEISFDVKVPEGISSENLVKNVEAYLKDISIECLGSDAKDVTEYYPDHTIEWCQHCETEVKLPLELGRYECPECGKIIANCTVCPECKNDCPALVQCETITLGTYKPYVEGQDEEDLDNGIEFTIPVNYAKKLVAESQVGWTYEEFLDNYTWDHTIGWIDQAREEEMLIDVTKLPSYKGE